MANIFVEIEEDLTFPKRARENDAGFDVVAASDPIIVGELAERSRFYRSVDYIEYRTGIKLEPARGHFTLLFPRSSVSKYNLVLANCIGLVDEGYRNEVLLRFKYIFQPKDLWTQPIAHGLIGFVDERKIYQKGDKICQLVFAQNLDPKLIEVDAVNVNTARGLGGFGSTGK